MRHVAGIVFAFAGLAGLAACSDPRPPTGRWEGFYETREAMIAARLEILADGTIRVSAPNAFMDFAAMSQNERENMRGELLTSLALAWSQVEPMALAFDGAIFRKPDGVAPQLEWNAEGRQMTVVVYPGLSPAIRVPLTEVEFFGGRTAAGNDF